VCIACAEERKFNKRRDRGAQPTDNMIENGERGGTRTLDPMIKSHVLYRLSYALTRRAV
jgi:hypothetical protein